MFNITVTEFDTPYLSAAVHWRIDELKLLEVHTKITSTRDDLFYEFVAYMVEPLCYSWREGRPP